MTTGCRPKWAARRSNFRGLLCRMCNSYLGHIEKQSVQLSPFTEYINDPPAKKVLKR